MTISPSSTPSKQQEYRVEAATDRADLGEKVTKLLTEGWKLEGSLQVVCVDGARLLHFTKRLYDSLKGAKPSRRP